MGVLAYALPAKAQDTFSLSSDTPVQDTSNYASVQDNSASSLEEVVNQESDSKGSFENSNNSESETYSLQSNEEETGTIDRMEDMADLVDYKMKLSEKLNYAKDTNLNDTAYSAAESTCTNAYSLLDKIRSYTSDTNELNLLGSVKNYFNTGLQLLRDKRINQISDSKYMYFVSANEISLETAVSKMEQDTYQKDLNHPDTPTLRKARYEK